MNFAAVVVEDFWGYYKHGETVILPQSGADLYNYARHELLYSWEIFSTGAPPSTPLLGTHTTPPPGLPSGVGQILQMGFNVNQGTGYVSGLAQFGPVSIAGEQGVFVQGQNYEGVFTVSYYTNKGAQTNTQDGILLVHTIARRLSSNAVAGSSIASLVNGQVVVTGP